MSNSEIDPAASTQKFRAFVQSEQPERSGGRVLGISLTVTAVACLIAVVVAVWLVLRG